MSQAAALGAALPVTPTQLQRPADDDRTPTVARMAFMPRTLAVTPESTLVPTPAANLPSRSETKSTDLDQDGPLFRACAASLLRRALVIKASEKRIVKLGEASLSAVQQHCSAQTAMDDELESFCISNPSSRLDVLGAVWAESLERERRESKVRREAERARLETMLDRMRDSIERLRSLETRRKTFEAESKSFYGELAKYLARTDTDPLKIASFDAKQHQRTLEFTQARLDYFSALESIVESEERGLAGWLRDWAGIPEAPVELEQPREHARQANREEHRRTLARSMTLSVAASLARGEFEAGETASDVDGVLSDDGGFASTPSNSAFSQHSTPAMKKRRPVSVGQFDREGTADRIKGFLKASLASAQNSVQSSPRPGKHGHSHSQSLSQPVDFTSLTPASPKPSPASSPLLAPIPSGPVSVSPAMTKQQMLSLERRKEGVLWATAKPTGHTTTGDGGGQWHNTWTVLSEGQLVEFAHWKSHMEVRNTPINLRYATARVSRNSDRRFCFEVLTPQNRRIYQALSDQDVKDWVSSIQKSIESLLNGTSSVRHFDATRLLESSPAPYDFSDFGSTPHLARESPSQPSLSTSPSGGLSQISNRLPGWGGISRRASLGPNRQPRKERLSVGPNPPSSPPAVLVRTASSEGPRKRHYSAQSEGATPTSPSIGQHLAQHSLGLHPEGVNWRPTFGRRSFSGSSDGATADSDRSDAASDRQSFNEEDKWIASAVQEFAVPPVSPETLARAKIRNAAQIQDLVELPGNSKCADCGEQDPRWASTSLGVFICIRCSGQHRSLGTHLSKVRSVDLDDWSDEQLASMVSWGNARANEHWEAHKPASISATDENIASFIQRKYVGREWVAEMPSIDRRPSGSAPQLPPIVEARQSSLPFSK